MEERIKKLKEQIEELKQWKIANSIQQLPFNPPVNTETIMHTDHFIMQNTLTFSPNTPVAIEVDFGGTIVYLAGFINT